MQRSRPETSLRGARERVLKLRICGNDGFATEATRPLPARPRVKIPALGARPRERSRLSSYRPARKDFRGRILKLQFRGHVPRPQYSPVYFGASSLRAARCRGVSGRDQTLEAKRGVLRPQNVPFEGGLGELGRRTFAFSGSCLVDSAQRGRAPSSGILGRRGCVAQRRRGPTPDGCRIAVFLCAAAPPRLCDYSSQPQRTACQ
jgi:hypothetical protein